MGRITTQTSDLAQWHDLVKNAEKNNNYYIDEEIEFYLICMLQRFIKKPDLASSIIALDYLIAQKQIDVNRRKLLQDVGDKCLLFSGLFPEQARKRNVSVSYFVGLGEAAYYNVASFSRERKDLVELFESLGNHFIELMDLLMCIRELSKENSLDLIEAEDLWSRTGSKYALKVIKRYTDGFLIQNFPKQ